MKKVYDVQNKKGKARAYQVIKAIERLKLEHDTEGGSIHISSDLV